MKKIILISALCLLCNVIIAQMSFSSRNFITETVDEFGDKTGEVKVGISAKGYFSNSATTNSCAELIISMTKNLSWADLYEYCGNHPSNDLFNITFEGVATKENVDASTVGKSETKTEESTAATSTNTIVNASSEETNLTEAGSINTEPKTVTIPGGLGSDGVAQVLYNAGVIDNASAFNRYLIDQGKDRIIRSGTKVIPAGATYAEIAAIITR